MLVKEAVDFLKKSPNLKTSGAHEWLEQFDKGLLKPESDVYPNHHIWELTVNKDGQSPLVILTEPTKITVALLDVEDYCIGKVSSLSIRRLV
jgi:hypothetical protein